MENLIKEDLSTFVRDVDRLRNIIRYATAPRNAAESVAEHSYYVAVYVLKLAAYYNFDVKKAMALALLHDFSEIYISDVPHPIKKRNPALEKALEDAEEKVNKERLSDTVADWLHEFNDGTSAEGLICSFADVLSVVSYAKYEMDLGNKAYMTQVYEGVVNRYKNDISNLHPYLKDGFTDEDIIRHVEAIVNTSIENS